MTINVVMGFFLPVPPLAGGATEKSWHGLAREFARRGHDVTILSRRWPGLPDDELRDGVRHRRLRGFDHTASLARNLWLDLLWSRRVGHALTPADVTVVNSVVLPLWLGPVRGQAGRLVVMPGRVPKGQFRLYRRLDLVLAVSNTVREAVVAEQPALAPRIRVTGYPIDCRALAGADRPPTTGGTTVGYVGRLHREKGLELLVAAATRVAARRDLPPWNLVLCGPTEVAHGGSGAGFVSGLERTLAAVLPADRIRVLPPEFTAARLAAVYRQIDVFCYPSLAERGETFGVAVAEAMAAGAVPVVSGLSSFADLVRPGENGLVIDHRAADAPDRLAAAIGRLFGDPVERGRLAAAARASVERYDFPRFAEHLLDDFSTLLPEPVRQS